MSIELSTKTFKSEFIAAKNPSKILMIVLHGKGDSSEPFRHFHEELKLKNINFLLLNAPKKFMGGYSWYNEPPKMSEQILDIRQKMLTVLYDLKKQGWKTENMFLFGFSQGALISADVALHFPFKLAGVIGVSGYFHFYPRWRINLNDKRKKTPWLITHGKYDEVLPISVTKFGVRKLQSVGLKVDWIELKKRHVIKEEEYPIIRNWVLEKTKYRPYGLQQNSKV